MKEVIQSYRTGEIKIEDAPAPLCKRAGVLVRNVCSLISPGTEKLMIQTGQKTLLGKALARPDLVRRAWAKAKKEGALNVFKESLNRLDEPVPLGYNSAGIVVEIGEGVKDFKIGDRVACAGATFASHAEYVWVPTNLCVPIPESVSFEEATFTMLGSIALHGIRCAELSFGESVAVIGLGLIGLIAAQMLACYGCKVICLDIDKRKCELAKNLYKDLQVSCDGASFMKLAEHVSKGSGVGAVIITAASKDNSPILLAEEICRKRATIVLVGVADIHLTRKVMWEKEVKFVVSKAAGPGSLEPTYERKGVDYPIEYVRWAEKRNLQEFLSLVASDKVNVRNLITHSYSIEHALQAYDTILKASDLYIGVLLTYDELPKLETKINLHNLPLQTGPSKNIGLIGAGLFAKNILLPVLKKLKNTSLTGIATTSSHSSIHVGKKYGFGYATTNYEEIISDSNIDSVIIATPHNLHAKMVLEALKAGKHVFVEKPLCLNHTELSEIVDTYTTLETKPKLMTGFNRPFSALARKTKKLTENRTCPLILHYRINAGYIPPSHWVQDMKVGGGRIVGEVCHFIHFLEFLVGSEPVTVFGQGICKETGKYLMEDNTIISLSFGDGSIGTILYSSQGSKSFSRERVEIFCEDSVIVIEDFKKLLHVEGNKKKMVNLISQDMGYKNELQFFFEASNFDETVFQRDVSAMLTTFCVLDSLEKGAVVNIES